MSLAGARRHRGRRAAGAVLWLALALGCGSRGPVHELGRQEGLGFLDGLVLSDRAVVAAPDGRWEVEEGSGAWTFRSLARFYCLVREASDARLAFRFAPDQRTSALSFTATWDGRPLLDRPAQPSVGGSELAVPPAFVTPGLHVLEVSRVDWADPPELADEHDNRFTGIGYSVGDEWYPFLPAAVERDRVIALLIARGVTGKGIDKHAGSLLDGPRTARAEVELPAAGTLSFAVENASAAPARFSLRAGDAAVTRLLAPGGLAEIAVPVIRGRQELELGVSGSPAGVFVWGAPWVAADTPAASTPIVLVTLDTTRRDALSPYGGPPDASPRLAALARQATIFDNAWAASPWTLPSHASIFTGLYPARHGAGVWEDHLTGRHATVASLLAEHGYLTAGFAGGALSSAVWGVGRGFASYRDPEGFETRGDRLIDAVAELLERRHPRRLFLFVNLFDPHALYDAPASYGERFGVAELRSRAASSPIWRELAAGSNEAWRDLIAGEGELTAEGLDYVRAAYLAEVAFADAQLGRLLDLLDRRGLLDPALVIVVADHGELLGEGGFLSHCCRLDPELMEVPLVVKWPGQREGRRVSELATHVDLFATMLAAAGIDGPPRDGLPLSPTGSPELAARSSVYMEEHESRIHPFFDNMRLAQHLFGIQQLDWREVLWQGGIRCSSGVPGAWEEAPCAASWSQRLMELGELAELPAEYGIGSHDVALSDAERDSLEALGYVR